MIPGFFPYPWFGWAFYTIILILLILAAIEDTRRAIIPKKITLTLAGVGLLLNLFRGLLLGLNEQPVYLLGAGPVLGPIDGVLFGVFGFIIAFAAFFLLWIFGLVGGGDVKVFAAIGACVGPSIVALWIYGGTFVIVSFITVIRMGLLFATAGMAKTREEFFEPGPLIPNTQGRMVPSKRQVTYSLPLLISTAIVMLLMYSQDLGLGEFKP
jgi:Flp pilus assembly protein protease CpaA